MYIISEEIYSDKCSYPTLDMLMFYGLYDISLHILRQLTQNRNFITYVVHIEEGSVSHRAIRKQAFSFTSIGYTAIHKDSIECIESFVLEVFNSNNSTVVSLAATIAKRTKKLAEKFAKFIRLPFQEEFWSTFV